MPKLFKAIAFNLTLSAGSRIVGNLIALAVVALIARSLPAATVGYYFTILAYLYSFGFLADLGLYALLLRDISRPRADEKKIVSQIFSLRLAALTLAGGLAFSADFFLPYPPVVKLSISLGIIFLFFLNASQVLIGIFQKYLKIKIPALAEISSRIIQLFLIWLAIKFKAGLPGLIGALSVSSAAAFLINYLGAKKLVAFKLVVDFSAWRKIIAKALPLGAAVIITALYFRFDTIMISLLKGPSDVGIYNIGYRVLEALIFFPAMFVGLIMPRLSKLAVTDIDKFKNLFIDSLKVISLFTLPAVIGLIIEAPKIVVLLGGQNYLIAAPVLKILSGAIAMIFLGALTSNALIALNKQKLLAWIYAGGLIFNIAANLLFIPTYSFIGASWSTFGTEGLVSLLMVVFLIRQYKLPFFNPYFLKLIVPALLMALSLKLMLPYSLLLSIPVGAFIYFASLFIFSGLKQKEFKF